jgi:O-acetyl-ADP-ribose deacetylase (regulator of RNase III)
MATGVGGALRRAGGDAIELAAVGQGPLSLGQAVLTTAGTLAARIIIHAVETSSAVGLEAGPG